MCQLFASQDPTRYACETRSIRLSGYSTSIRLEAAFWEVLEEIAAGEGRSLPQFLSTLHAEVMDQHGDIQNFTSLLRCTCLIEMTRRAPAESQTPAGTEVAA